jgi:hypothetical protein
VDNDFSGTLVFTIALVVILILGSVGLIRYIIDTRNKMRCPNCRNLWAAQKLRDELLGIFKKGEESGDPENPEFRMVTYEKYRIYYKCKYCGHEWTFLTSRKQ